MFKEKKIFNKKIYYSTLIPVPHFFTTRDLIIKDNKKLVCDYLNIQEKNLICPNQTHSDNIQIVDDRRDYPNCDSLVLTQKNLAIYLNFADCTPLVFYDSKNNICAIAHAGWRGTAQRIGPKTVSVLVEQLGSNVQDIKALIGPCIGFSSFETSIEALEALKATTTNPKGLFRDKFADLKGINKRQLEELGIKTIDICPYCTVLDNDKFFSYRKENKTKNRHSALICL